jgi:hypothetical protein
MAPRPGFTRPDVNDALVVDERRKRATTGTKVGDPLAPPNHALHAVRQDVAHPLEPWRDEPPDVVHRTRSAFSTGGHHSLRHHDTKIRSATPP